jgi:hypothetical protein
VYGFSSLVKQNKKGENCAVFCFAGKRKLLYLYLRCDYMGKIKKKSSANYYSCLVPFTACTHWHARAGQGREGERERGRERERESFMRNFPS